MSRKKRDPARIRALADEIDDLAGLIPCKTTQANARHIAESFRWTAEEVELQS